MPIQTAVVIAENAMYRDGVSISAGEIPCIVRVGFHFSFDRFPDAAILDQRLLWLVPLVFVVIRGAGYVSLDTLLKRWWTGSRSADAGYASA